MTTDEQLVAAYLAAPNERAFRDLYLRHTPSLWRTALRLARGAEEEARDLVQETWLRAVSRLAGFRWEASLQTWLVSIAVNCAHEKNRNAGRLATVADIESAMTAELWDRSERAGGPASVDPVDLARAIDALPDGYQRVLVLHDVEGYTHAEIGRVLGIEPGTSKSQLHRARAWVRGRLTADGGGEP